MHELPRSCAFWAAARSMGEAGLVVTDELRSSEMEAEARRWGHLGAERERLERGARERMERHGEPWEVAVGRGLEE